MAVIVMSVTVMEFYVFSWITSKIDVIFIRDKVLLSLFRSLISEIVEYKISQNDITLMQLQGNVTASCFV